MAYHDETGIGISMYTLQTNEPVSDMSDELHKLVVELQIPTESEECAICLEKIEECEVTGFEMLNLDVSRPKHKKMILPCSHYFSANALIVHWLTCSMRCPLCRDGVDAKLCIATLPEEWIIPATAYVDKDIQERAEIREREDVDIAAALIANELVIQNRYVHVSMHALLVTSAGDVHRIPLNFSQNLETTTGDFWMLVNRADVRKISAIISRWGCYAMTLSIYSHHAIQSQSGIHIADRGTEVSTSGVMRLPHAFRLTRATEPFAEFPNTGHVTVARTGQSVTHPTVAEHSAFNLQWFYQNNRMLDTLMNINFRINMNFLMSFVAHESL